MTPSTMTTPASLTNFAPTTAVGSTVPDAPDATEPSVAPVAAPVTTAAAGSPILGTYRRQAPLFVRGEGVYMIDEDGKRYLDFVAGIAVSSLGHADAGVMNAMREAMETGLVHTSNLYRTADRKSVV